MCVSAPGVVLDVLGAVAVQVALPHQAKFRVVALDGAAVVDDDHLLLRLEAGAVGPQLVGSE